MTSPTPSDLPTDIACAQPWIFAAHSELHLLANLWHQNNPSRSPPSISTSRAGNQLSITVPSPHSLLDPLVINFNFSCALPASPHALIATIDGDGDPSQLFKQTTTLALFDNNAPTPYSPSSDYLTYFYTHTSPEHLIHILHLENHYAQLSLLNRLLC